MILNKEVKNTVKETELLRIVLIEDELKLQAETIIDENERLRKAVLELIANWIHSLPSTIISKSEAEQIVKNATVKLPTKLSSATSGEIDVKKYN